MKMNVRRFFAIAFSTMLFAGASNLEAANIRFFVKNGSGLYEVKGSTGGRFVTSPTGERINAIGLGVLPVLGYTDRAQRGESLVGMAEGSGLAVLTVTYQDQFSGRTSYILRPTNVPLTWAQGGLTVPVPANQDNVIATVQQGGRTDSRRLPIGTRP